jgi:hypothetical protein
LTLDQVRQAGHLAWHPVHHYLFSEGRLLRVVLFSPLGDDPSTHITMNLRPSSLHGDERHIQSGWRHLDGCDCRFCQGSKTATPRKSNGHSRRDSG